MIMDTTVGEIASEVRLSERIIGQYLKPSTNYGVVATNKIIVPPSIPITANDEQYEFIIPKVERSLIDVRGILMHIKGRLMKKVGANYVELPPDEKVVLLTNTPHALFENISSVLGANQETYHQSMYPHKSYLRQILKHKIENTSLASSAGFAFEGQATGAHYLSSDGRTGHYAQSKQIEFLGELLMLIIYIQT